MLLVVMNVVPSMLLRRVRDCVLLFFVYVCVFCLQGEMFILRVYTNEFYILFWVLYHSDFSSFYTLTFVYMNTSFCQYLCCARLSHGSGKGTQRNGPPGARMSLIELVCDIRWAKTKNQDSRISFKALSHACVAGI